MVLDEVRHLLELPAFGFPPLVNVCGCDFEKPALCWNFEFPQKRFWDRDHVVVVKYILNVGLQGYWEAGLDQYWGLQVRQIFDTFSYDFQFFIFFPIIFCIIFTLVASLGYFPISAWRLAHAFIATRWITLYGVIVFRVFFCRISGSHFFLIGSISVFHPYLNLIWSPLFSNCQ